MATRGSAFSKSRLNAAVKQRAIFGNLVEHLEPRLLMSTLVDLLGNHGGGANTGVNPNEPILTQANVSASGSFAKLFTAALDGQLYAQPLAAHDVNITRGSSLGIHDVIFGATMHDSLYAVDANTGAILWQDSFLQILNPQVTGTAVPTTGVTTVPVKSGDNALIGTVLGPELGILSTPVLDPATGIIYVETSTQEIRTGNGTTGVATFATGDDIHYVQRLWAINISDGSVAVVPTNNPPTTLEPKTGGQIIGDVILNPTGTNTVPSFTSYTGYKYVAGPFIKGTGDNGSFVTGTGDSATEDGWVVNPLDTTTPWGSLGKTPMQVGDIAFNAIIQMNRVALTEINGTIYVGFASHGDDGPYYGWLLGYNASTLANTQVFITAPTFETFATVSGNGGDNGGFDSQAGIWSGGGSITTDGTFLYFTTGNGAFNPNTSNFSSTFTSDNHGNIVQLPLDNDYGDAVLKLAIDPTATQSSINLSAGVVNDPLGTYDPDGGYNANGFGLKVVDFFTPSNELYLNLKDEDLNAGAVLLIPSNVTSTVPGHVGDPMLVAGGKEGRMYLIDQYNMGGFNTSYPSPVDANNVPLLGPDPSTFDRVLGEYYYFETLNPGTTSGTETNRAYTSPSYYNGDVYFGLSGSAPEIGIPLSSFEAPNSPPGSGILPVPNFRTSTTFVGDGDTATITSNGAANPILWNVDENNSATDTLVAYNASLTITGNNTIAPLYQSPTTGANSLTKGLSGATGVKFSVPTVVNGMVYVGTGGGTGTGGHILGTIVAYGLVTPTLHAPTAPTATATSSTSVHLTWSRTSTDQENEDIVQRSTDGTHWSTVQILGNGSTSYDDTTVASGINYFYRIEEAYGAATTQISTTVQVTTVVLALNGVVSEMPQGSGTLDIPLALSGAPTEEPRFGGPTRVIFTFNEPVTLPAGTFSLTLSSGSGNAVISGNTVVVGMAGATNNQILTVTLNNVKDAGGNLSTFSVQIKVILGDTNGDGVVDIQDLTAVANNWQQNATTPATGDLDGSGFVDIADLTDIANNWQAGTSSGGGSSTTNSSESLHPALTTTKLSASQPTFAPPASAPQTQLALIDSDADLLKNRLHAKWKFVLNKLPRI